MKAHEGRPAEREHELGAAYKATRGVGHQAHGATSLITASQNDERSGPTGPQELQAS